MRGSTRLPTRTGLSAADLSRFDPHESEFTQVHTRKEGNPLFYNVDENQQIGIMAR